MSCTILASSYLVLLVLEKSKTGLFSLTLPSNSPITYSALTISQMWV